MADAATAIGATDLFGINANFLEQNSNLRTNRQFSMVQKANGDFSCEASYDVRDDVRNSFRYCGTAIKTDLGTFASAFGVSGSYVVDTATLTWSNTGQPTLEVVGHQHAANTHTSGNAFDWSGILPATGGGGIGIPTMGTNYTVTVAGADTAVSELQLVIAMQHIDVLDSSGDHLAGTWLNCRVDLSVSGPGVSSDITLGSNWVLDDDETSDSNTEFDTWALTAHDYILRT